MKKLLTGISLIALYATNASAEVVTYSFQDQDSATVAVSYNPTEITITDTAADGRVTFEVPGKMAAVYGDKAFSRKQLIDGSWYGAVGTDGVYRYTVVLNTHNQFETSSTDRFEITIGGEGENSGFDPRDVTPSASDAYVEQGFLKLSFPSEMVVAYGYYSPDDVISKYVQADCADEIEAKLVAQIELASTVCEKVKGVKSGCSELAASRNQQLIEGLGAVCPLL